MGGSDEFVECFCGGAVAEGGSGAVVRVRRRVAFEGRAGRLVMGFLGKVAADKSVGIFRLFLAPRGYGGDAKNTSTPVSG